MTLMRRASLSCAAIARRRSFEAAVPMRAICRVRRSSLPRSSTDAASMLAPGRQRVMTLRPVSASLGARWRTGGRYLAPRRPAQLAGLALRRGHPRPARRDLAEQRAVRDGAREEAIDAQ